MTSSWLPSFGGLMRRSRSEVVMPSTSSTSPRREEQVSSIDKLLQQHLSLDLDRSPEVEGESSILGQEDVRRLGEGLPGRLIGTTWRLVFSTDSHGFSLKSLYRKFQAEASSALLVIEDTRGGVFGALVSCPIR